MALEVFMQQAIICHNNELFDEAENLYKKALALAPNNPDILNLLGLVAQSKGQNLIAVDYFYKALLLNPFSQEYNFSLAFSLEKLGKYNEAIAAYNKASSIKEALNNIGNIYLNLGNGKEAREYYQRAIRLDENYEEPKINLAFLSKDLETLQSFDNYLAKYYMALLCFENNDADKALSFLEDELQTDFANGLKGEILFFQKKYDEAKTFFEMATKINQQNYKAQIFLADIATIKDDYKEAEIYYKAVTEAEPKNINAIINYANMLYKSGNKALALEEYRKAILIDDKNFAALNNLGLIVKDEGDYQEALGLFFAAMNVDATNDDVAINALETLILYAEDNEGDARKIAQNWLKHYPNNVYAKHLVAAFEGRVDNDNLQYSQNLFNAFSDNYEGVLHKIGYRLPQKVKELFGQIEGRVLDIGCGTGLLGELIKNDCNTLVGIDLSEKMLNVARGKNCYDELVLIDGEQYLQKNTDFDYMFALDVFCYVGDLSIFVNCMKNKAFFFSVERGKDKDFELQINGRYKHSAEYIKCLLSGIDYICEDIVLRVENGQEVAGMIFYKKTP